MRLRVLIPIYQPGKIGHVSIQGNSQVTIDPYKVNDNTYMYLHTAYEGQVKAEGNTQVCCKKGVASTLAKMRGL